MWKRPIRAARGFAVASLLVPSLTLGAPMNNPMRDTMPDTWVATDALRRAVPTHADVGAVKPDKYVAMFYFTWLGHHGPDVVHDLTKMLAGNPETPKYGPVGAFHWWGEPYFGYYRSEDKWVIRKHAQMLADAGVDVIVCDVTNAETYDKTIGVLFETFAQMRAEGNRTPGVAFITNSHHAKTAQKLYDTWYKPGKFKDLWFTWRGKPLLMSNKEGLSDEVLNFFEIRHSWAFSDEHHRKMWMGDGKEKWPWIDNYPQGFGWRESPDKAEAMPVSVATHPIAGVGRSHDGKRQPPEGQNNPLVGTYFAKQWERALEVDPELIFVTGWNEWVAQRFLWGQPAKVGKIAYRTPGEGESYFVDAMTQEFSRDAEPMKGGYGDNYYYQLAAGIRRFKGARPAPAIGVAKTIKLDGPATQWDDVTYKYDVAVGNTAHRDEPGFAKGVRLTDDTGRNDIREVRVAHDAQNVYFLVRCVKPIEQPDGQSRLVLLLNTDGKPDTGFAGFDLAVNRDTANGAAKVESVDARYATSGRTKPLLLPMRVEGDALTLAVPRNMLERDGKLNFDFKWADNLPATPTAMDFIDKGDCAPGGRFAYRFAE